MSTVFQITKRHYDIITKQAADNFPTEAGGFLGGKDFVIKAILPIFNQHLANKTDTFAFTAEDVDRAHQFFAKHNLDYYGLYHTHPSGIPEPSQTDIDTGHKYHFIIGIPGKDPSKAVLRAFEVQRKTVIPLAMNILLQDVKSVDLQSTPTKSPMMLPQNTLLSEAQALGELLENIKNEKPQYKKDAPINTYKSDFSALA